MVGHYFDNFLIYIKAFEDTYDRREKLTEGLSKDLVWTISDAFGWKQPSGKELVELHRYIKGYQLSGSATSSGSFGHIIVDDLTAGSITNLCEIANVIPSVMISSSAQIASDISGSFTSGFGYSGTVSGSATSTGSFTLLNVTSNYVVGDSSEITNAISALTSDTVSGSAQLATDISGSFTKGFEFSGTISGSSTSKLDIGRLDFNDLSVSDFVNSELTEIIPTGTLVDGSATTIASQISGAFDSGFEFTGAISGSSTTSGSFNIVCADVFPTVDLTGMTGLNQSGHISSSAQLAACLLYTSPSPRD